MKLQKRFTMQYINIEINRLDKFTKQGLQIQKYRNKKMNVLVIQLNGILLVFKFFILQAS